MLTPIDIQNYNIKTIMGGYSKKDTDDFIASILESYEQLYKENKDLKDKISSLSEGVQYYKQMEGTLQKALVLAEKTSTETQQAAKNQAEAIMKDASTKVDLIINEAQNKSNALVTEAENKAKALVTDAENKANTLINEAREKAKNYTSKADEELTETRNSIRKLVQGYENYRLQFKKLASSQIEMLESDAFAIHVPEIEKFIKEDVLTSEDIQNMNKIHVGELLEGTAPKSEAVENPQEQEATKAAENDADKVAVDNTAAQAIDNTLIQAEVENVKKEAAEREAEAEKQAAEAEKQAAEAEKQAAEAEKQAAEEKAAAEREAAEEKAAEELINNISRGISAGKGESPFINSKDLVESVNQGDDKPQKPAKEESPFVDIPVDPIEAKKKREAEREAAKETEREAAASSSNESPFVNPNLAGTVSPEKKPDEAPQSYLDYFMTDSEAEAETKKKEEASKSSDSSDSSAESSPFVFIDPE